MWNLKNIPWKLSDLKEIPSNGKKVFSCFHCGGGSTMGYKLAGYEVLGGVEIDPSMMRLYRANHNPKHSYLMGVQEFKNLNDLPKELYELDVLDGSPPCSSFSIAGSREKAWGEKKKFREGQAEQVLDDLFFHYIDIAKKLQPKVVVAENVKGLIQGNARGYVKEIFKAFKDAGYEAQLFLLNAAVMGVPQKRERTFFIANRLGKKISLSFNEKQITNKEAFAGLVNQKGKPLSESFIDAWKYCSGNNLQRVEDYFSKLGNRKLWNYSLAILNKVSNTQPSTVRHISQERPELISDMECIRIQSFPDDYNFLDQDAGYVCGMSVPPLMMQRVALEIFKQLLS